MLTKSDQATVCAALRVNGLVVTRDSRDNDDTTSGQAWAWELEDLGAGAPISQLAALLSFVPAGAPTIELQMLKAYLAGIERERHSLSDVERSYLTLRPLLDELENESCWSRSLLRKIRNAALAMADTPSVSLGDTALKKLVAEELGVSGGFVQVISRLLASS